MAERSRSVILSSEVLLGIAFYSGLEEAPKAIAPYERWIHQQQDRYPQLLGVFAFNERGESEQVYRALDLLQSGHIFRNPDLFSNIVELGEEVRMVKERILDPWMTPEIEQQFKELGQAFREEFGKKEKE